MSRAAAAPKTTVARLDITDDVRARMKPLLNRGTDMIIGRNSFQRKREDALKLLDTLTKIFLGQA